MNAFETTAIVEDASHLALRSPVPFPVAQECRVIVLAETPVRQDGESWPARFFEEIRVADPAFARPAQGASPQSSAQFATVPASALSRRSLPNSVWQCPNP